MYHNNLQYNAIHANSYTRELPCLPLKQIKLTKRQNTFLNALTKSYIEFLTKIIILKNVQQFKSMVYNILYSDFKNLFLN